MIIFEYVYLWKLSRNSPLRAHFWECSCFKKEYEQIIMYSFLSMPRFRKWVWIDNYVLIFEYVHFSKMNINLFLWVHFWNNKNSFWASISTKYKYAFKKNSFTNSKPNYSRKIQQQVSIKRYYCLIQFNYLNFF